MDSERPILSAQVETTATPSPALDHTIQYGAQFGSQPASDHAPASPPKYAGAPPSGPSGPVSMPSILKPKSAAGGSNNATATPRLRSSIACARCRKSKIKCTNAGAGTTCEACAHSNRECVYPAPGTGGVKRDGEGENGVEKTKRPRVRKSEPTPDKMNIDISAVLAASPEYMRSKLGPNSDNSHLSIRLSPAQPPPLGGRVWSEVFDLFQIHYGSELSFLHAPTFLPRLADDPAAYAAMSRSGQGHDSQSLHLLQLGLLTLTARHHEGLVQQFSTRDRRESVEPALSASEYFAGLLKNRLFQGEASSQATASIEQPSLAKIQALLMLSLYEWSARRGVSAWINLGLAIRMAQALELLTEDLDVPAALSAPMSGSMSSMLLHVSSVSHQDTENSEAAIVEEESVRRTVWSCFVLDRYISNGTSRPTAMDTAKICVQLPCGEKAWAFGDKVCTPFFNGSCSQQQNRAKRKHELLRRVNEKDGTSNFGDSPTSRIPCEYEQDEGLVCRFVKLTDLWGRISQWSYQGGKASGLYAPWDDRSTYWSLKLELHKFIEEMPRSYRFTKANSQAHMAQRTYAPYMLLHTLYSVCKLVMLREFLPFAPTNVNSPEHLDETEISEPNVYNRQWHSTTLKEMFKIARDLLELFQTCKARSSFQSGPITAFAVYLVSFVGVYALHFPQMDSEGSVFGMEADTNVIFERQVRIIEAIQILAAMRGQLPMAEYWFRTLHRAHRFYVQTRSALHSDAKLPQVDAAGILDGVFKDLGAPQDDSVVYSLPVNEPPKSTNGHTERLPSPQMAWKPVNTAASPSRFVDPLDRPAPMVGPQSHGKWYQERGNPPVIGKSISPRFNEAGTYITPPNTLPPITAVSSSSQASSATPKISPKQLSLSFSGEDVATFVDAKSEKDISSIRAGWNLIKGSKEPSIIGSPNHRAQEMKRMEAIGAGWIGLLWQWS